MSDQFHSRHARLFALKRIRAELDRAESELPQLAAPDGTVAVQIDDLRAVITMMDELRDTIALGKRQWTERWNGSQPAQGSAIWSVDEYGRATQMLAYFGGDEATHDAVSRIVALHNARLIETVLA